MDRIGTRVGYALAIVWWSLAAMAHALAHTPFGFGIARAALGVGEAGNFPAAIKTVAEWFPKKERAFATGIFNAGSNVGAIVAPLTVPWIALNCGWRWAFVLTGAIGFVWLLFWLPITGARGASESFGGRTGPYSERSAGSTGRKDSVDALDSASSNVGVRHRQISDRSGLVVLSFLDSGLLPRAITVSI